MLNLKKKKQHKHTHKTPKHNGPWTYKAKCSCVIKAEKEPMQNKNVEKIINMEWKFKYTSS